MPERDYYEILGVPRTASDTDIRNAHRRLALKHHPDRNKNSPESQQKFAEIQQAYDALSDPEKRRQYDQFGHAGPGAQQAPDPYGYGHSTWDDNGVRVEDFDASDFGRSGTFENIFDQLFNERGPFGRQRRQRAASQPDLTNRNVEYPVNLTFEQAARGTTLPITIQKPGNRSETIEVKIPAGVKTASRIRIKGRGQPGRGGPGDLFIVVNVRDHAYFRRDNLDILLDLPISLWEAVLGAQVTVPTLEGNVTINVPPGTSSGAKLRIRERGIRRGSETGDQYCIVKIVVPRDLGPHDSEVIRTLRDRHPLDPRSEVKW